MLKKLFWFVVILIFLASLAGGGILYWLVALHPGDEIKAENINSILGKESPVFYSDGKTRLGVFFDEAHRQYVPYDHIPVNFINALVASEDNRFFTHFGFDVLGILRAAVINIKAGRIVQGGSTLTQQTAKNLFKRKTRSFQEKFKELLFALRLEYHYPKEKIFEFYANQFYVSGNGHGLGVAARYYFNKKPEQLTLLECAYIAGSVKRPNYYNPFLKKSEESRKKAIKRGKARVNYVLGKMLELEMISDYQYSHAMVSDVDFSKGQVGYSLDYVMEMVKDAVTSDEITDALEEHEIGNIATSGVRIITTVNKNLQEKTLYALRHDLSRLDVRLRGYEREEVQKELAGLDYRGDTAVEERNFVFGTIKNIRLDIGSPEIEIDLGRRLGTGVIDRKGLQRMVAARVKWLKNPWTDAKAEDYGSFLDQLLIGDKVWVSVRGKNDDSRLMLDLEKFPEVNGGALVVKDGRIEAMAGGVENRFYNRAVYAKRTMGSSYKPFVFAAALQLGWNGVDPLRNSRDVFIYQNQPYFPRPDHHSPFEEVSMSWAGVHSENVASVWLLANLCAKLDSEEFREVAARVGLGPLVIDGENEPYSRFRSRIRDRYGIVMNYDVLRKAAYRKALKNVETDLIFVGRDIDYAAFSKMHYGLGFDSFRNEIESKLINDGNTLDEGKRLSSREKKELRLRLNILKNNFLDLELLKKEFDGYVEQVKRFDPDFPSPLSFDSDSMEPVSQNRRLFYDSFANKYHFLEPDAESGGMTQIGIPQLTSHIDTLDEREKQQFWSDVYLGGKVSAESFTLLQKQLEQEMEILREALPYSMDVLENVSDFRILVGLKFIIAFARELGIKSDLEPVLSFPLGSNVVTLLETLRMYEGLVTGVVTDTGTNEVDNGDLLYIIDRIESTEGEVLYRPMRQRKRVLAKETSFVVGHILENIIKYGTGRYADRNIKLKDNQQSSSGNSFESLDLSIPVLGKTGTANRYTNASFFGFLPVMSEEKDSLAMKDGYAVGVYVGFDDNKEMRKGATRISGAAGALPSWSEIVNAIVMENRYGEHLDPVDLSFYGLALKREDTGQKNIEAAADNGGIVGAKVKVVDPQDRYHPSILTYGSIDAAGRFEPARPFLPFWKVRGTAADIRP